MTTEEHGTRFCCQAPGVPLEDQLLVQKLLLENDPATFFRHANRLGGPGMTAGRVSTEGIGALWIDELTRT